MNTNKKMPISQEKIFKIMSIVTIVVSSVFWIKNILEKNVTGTILIGVSIAVIGIIMLILMKKKEAVRERQLVLSMGLLFLIFIIAVNTGASYSDDFIMFLAVIAMTGLYLEPKYTVAQFIIADVLLVIMYLVHPEKAESLSQYIQSLAEFT